jgi:RNA polymerase sigma-70 factor (ECF subfamily)
MFQFTHHRNKWSCSDVNSLHTSTVATTSAMLNGLKDENDRTVWDQFDRRYRPILYGFARRFGLDETDAADVAQETLLRFVQEYRAGRYDRGRGRLRAWLMGIAKFRVADLKRARARRRTTRGESALHDVVDDSEASLIWDTEQRRFIYNAAIAELRAGTRLADRTIDAFERVVLHQQPVREVAESLGVTAQEVYDAKSRIVEKLREILPRYEALFAED